MRNAHRHLGSLRKRLASGGSISVSDEEASQSLINPVNATKLSGLYDMIYE